MRGFKDFRGLMKHKRFSEVINKQGEQMDG